MTRDSPWSETVVDRHLALAQYHRECCQCGLHSSVLDDPDGNPMTVAEWTCDMCKGLAVHRRVVDDRHKKADKTLGEKPGPKVPRAADGHHMALRYLTMSELLEREKRRAARAEDGG